jgi:hypothetical protein
MPDKGRNSPTSIHETRSNPAESRNCHLVTTTNISMSKLLKCIQDAGLLMG